MVVYDAPLLRNISNRQGPLMLLSGSEVRNALHLSQEAFIDFALLLGTDFTQRIKNVGPLRALKFIKQYGNIERILTEETKYPPRTSSYMEDVVAARTVFGMLPPVPELERLTKAEGEEDKVREIMSRYGFAKEMNWDYENALKGNFFSDDPNTGAQPEFSTFGLYV